MIFTPLETLPIVLVIAAVMQRKRLDSARWMVAICAFVAEMIFVVRNATTQFVRFHSLDDFRQDQCADVFAERQPH